MAVRVRFRRAVGAGADSRWAQMLVDRARSEDAAV
jgi:hypothetical protein